MNLFKQDWEINNKDQEFDKFLSQGGRNKQYLLFKA